MATAQQKREEEIERLAREAGRLIREADPETREELREAASALLREEAHQAEETKTEPEARRAMNPLAAGLGLLVIGAGLAFIVPFVGLSLLVIGVFAFVGGGVRSASGRSKTTRVPLCFFFPPPHRRNSRATTKCNNART